MARPVGIRPYSAADFESLYEIDQSCFPRGIAYSRRTLREYLSLPGAQCLVATVDAEIAGFILTAPHDNQGHIITLDVTEPYRRRGVGSLLLQAAEGDLMARGVDSLLLETATNNEAAIAFWRKHGYVSYGVARGYYARGVDAFLMRKSCRTEKDTLPT